jgi:hypothetical protein
MKRKQTGNPLELLGVIGGAALFFAFIAMMALR